MKKFMNTVWILAASALALSSCVEEQALAPQNEHPEMVNIEITAGAPVTKTLLDGTMQVKWDTDGESIKVIENTPNGFNMTPAYNGIIAQDGSTATFNLQLKYNSTRQEFNYWAISPISGVVEQGNNDLNAFTLQIPAVQKPKKTTFDYNAELLVSKKVTTQKQPEFGLTLQFARPIAIAEMTLKGIEDGENISEIVFSNTTEPLAGKMTYDLMGDKVVEYGTDNVKEIKMTFYYGLPATKAGTKVYFTAFPADFKDFTVIVKTDKGTYNKTVDCTTSKNPLFFKANHYAQFSVNNMTKVGLPEITFPDWNENAEQSGQGGKITIPYTLKNPVEGATIKLSTYNADSFIKNLKVENGNITFDLMPNEFETSQKYTIFVEYFKDGTKLFGGQVKVSQAAAVQQQTDLTFTLTVKSVNTSEVFADCVPSDNAETYVLAVKEKAEFDGMTQEQIINADIARYESDWMGLGGNLKTGTTIDFHEWNLKENTEYYVYAYGLTGDKVVTSKQITKQLFKTAGNTKPTMTLDYVQGEKYPAAGGHYSVDVIITNPIPNTKVEAKVFGDNKKSISNIVVNKISLEKYTIEFDVNVNYGGPRSANIKVIYGELEDYISKDQLGY